MLHLTFRGSSNVECTRFGNLFKSDILPGLMRSSKHHARKCNVLLKHIYLKLWPGGSLIDLLYICACLLGMLFREIWLSDQWVSSGTKEP